MKGRINRLWLFLTSPEWRRKRNYAHPGVVVWRLAWAGPAVLALSLLVAVMFAMRGPAIAGEVWREFMR